jgi:outer membrane protein OmpA-like peptidoglycan-associated protein
MTRDAARGRKAADNGPGRRRIGRLAATAGAFALALGAAPAVVSEAAAQSNSGITINNDVLNSLGPGPQMAPLTPMAPAAPPVPSMPPSQSADQAPLPAAAPAGNGLGFQPYGSGNFVVTRPGTLLFPPLQEPTSTLTPGFAGDAANHAARTRALDSAFAGGPEPSSQLLIAPERTLGQSDSVIVNLDALPPADPNADPADAPKLVLRQPPQPAPRKPAVPATALARMQQPGEAEEPAALAPEFAQPEAPVVAELPPEAPAEESVPEAAEPVAAAPSADETPAPTQPEAAAPALAEAAVPAASAEIAAPEAAPPVSRVEVAAPVAVAGAPVSLLPASSEAPAELQTASLTVGSIEDTSLLFEVDSAELSTDAQSELRVLAAALRDEAGGHIQVLGFASGQDGTEDQARKLALSRALKVRSFLIDEGIASARIRVRSLGDRAEGGPANRVDIKPIGS